MNLFREINAGEKVFNFVVACAARDLVSFSPHYFLQFSRKVIALVKPQPMLLG